MEKQKIVWTKKANTQLYSIMDYYAARNKSDFYSITLQNGIMQKLKKLNFTVALPQETSVKDLFYFTHNHISLFFVFDSNSITVKFVIDDRRNPKSIQALII